MNTITLHLRRFHVPVRNQRTGEEETITVTVTKEQLQAAQLVGQSSKELIERLCGRQGCTALGIGKADKLSIPLDLTELVREYESHREAEAREAYLLRHSHERRGDAD